MLQAPKIDIMSIEKAIQKFGFAFFRQTGSHRIYVKDDLQVVIPFHNQDLKKETLYQIIKGTGLTSEEFKKLL
ncbi:MAG: type II toxin-antitoxin system HicA family toxin [Desulfamplus sp.]|nr:type II toxin-antitoxin system HicA family toxin [Desulfamplus sp.]